MKRGGPLKRSASLRSRTKIHIRGRSFGRTAAAREECRRIVIERDGECQFNKAVDAHIRPPDALASIIPNPWLVKKAPQSGVLMWHGRMVLLGCSYGPLEVHERAHRRNVDITDPDECVALCRYHNQVLEDEPELGYAIGLLERGNGRPLRKDVDLRPRTD